MSYTVYADVRELTHDQWLDNRKSGIGGSDAGAIMGVMFAAGAGVAALMVALAIMCVVG